MEEKKSRKKKQEIEIEYGSDEILDLLTTEQKMKIYDEIKKQKAREYQRDYYSRNAEKLRKEALQKYKDRQDVKMREEAGKRPVGRPQKQ